MESGIFNMPIRRPLSGSLPNLHKTSPNDIPIETTMLTTGVAPWQNGNLQINGNIRGLQLQQIQMDLLSGKHTKSYWKLPFIVDCPIKNGDFP
jgi:hypothetical protein